MNTYKRQRFSPDIIRDIVWLYYRFNLSHRVDCFPRKNPGQLGLKESPTRRAMIMAGKSMPTVDKKVASILAGVLTA